jgi:hypothetical protein
MPSTLGLKTVWGALATKLSRAMIHTRRLPPKRPYLELYNSDWGDIGVYRKLARRSTKSNSQVLANSEVCALEHTFLRLNAIMPI